MTEGRREATTEWIRGAAIEEFTAVGVRGLTLSGVAARAHISKGAVYQRWPDKSACLRDLIANELPEIVGHVVERWRNAKMSVAELTAADLADEGHLKQFRFVTECVLAAHVDGQHETSVRAALRDLEVAFASRIPDSDKVPAIAWWVLCTLLANALLRTSNCPIPDSFSICTAQILRDIGRCALQANTIALAYRVITEFPALDTSRDFGDESAQVIVQAAMSVIDEFGVSEADARDIARSAGMTTGALYRRFNAKSDVLAAAFQAGLSAERYEWADDFITRVATGNIAVAADTLATRMKLVWSDTDTTRRLIDFTIAAHTDQAVLGAILGEMQRVADHRTQLFSALIEAGAIRGDLDPAALSWLIQVPTVGMRIVGALGIAPSDADLQAMMSAYLVFLVDDGTGGAPIKGGRVGL